jgi:dihydrolipoamide dehydrogenase
MDAEMAKMFQKMLTKQGFKFKLNTKVVGGKLDGDKVLLEVDAAKGGKPETVLPFPY